MPPTAAVTIDVGIVSANHLGVVHAYCAAGVDADGALAGEQGGVVGGINCQYLVFEYFQRDAFRLRRSRWSG